MARTIELNHYCTQCGNELETEFTMDKKHFNVARIDVAPCKTCERNRTTSGKAGDRSLQELPANTSMPPVKEPKQRMRSTTGPDPETGVYRLPPRKRGRQSREAIANRKAAIAEAKALGLKIVE